MNEYHFSVYFDNVKLADNMTLETALLFIKAYAQEHLWQDNFVISLRKMSSDKVCGESDRYKQDLAKLQECKRQIEDESYFEQCKEVDK